MIINLIIGAILEFFTALFYFLPVVTISSLPYVGTDLSNILDQIVLIWNAFMVTFPYAQTIWTIFLTVILPFEILLLVAKVILGSRVPAHTTNA